MNKCLVSKTDPYTGVNLYIHGGNASVWVRYAYPADDIGSSRARAAHHFNSARVQAELK